MKDYKCKNLNAMDHNLTSRTLKRSTVIFIMDYESHRMFNVILTLDSKKFNEL